MVVEAFSCTMSGGSSKSPSKTYSVFVGHIPLEVTRQNLEELFCQCGEIAEIFLPKVTKEMCYTYGFVRYKTIEAAKSATAELNGWRIKGSKMVVELAKETRACREIKTEQQNFKAPAFPKPPSVEMCVTSIQTPGVKTEHVEGFKNYGRLREVCEEVNRELTNHIKTESSHLDLDKLTTEINSETNSRLPARVSKVYDIDTSFESARSQLLKCKCSKSCAKDKGADEFMDSIKLMITNIDTFLQKADKKNYRESRSRENSFSQFSDSENDNSDLVQTSSVLKNTNPTNLKLKKSDSLKSTPAQSDFNAEKRISSSEEESGYTGSCSEDLNFSLNSSSDASFNNTSTKSMETLLLSVLGRGRGQKSPSQQASTPGPASANISLSQPLSLSRFSNHPFQTPSPVTSSAHITPRST